MSTTLHESKTWSMGVAENKKINVMEMRSLRSMCGVTQMEQVKNEVRKTTGVTRVVWLSRAVSVEVVWTNGEDGREY